MVSCVRTQDLRSRAWAKDFTGRSDLVPMAFLGALWMTMTAFVAPSGDFPLNDDWIYALGVKSILETGRFELPIESVANVFVQAYWGATFCLPFGFSFTALRFSTLTLGVVASWHSTSCFGRSA